ncbi:MAG: LysM domain-containing protein [Verrucomicrobiae bacterium]|nr:LysM domain-containing protein [Verrucomicrobiae bacterium]
MNRMTCRFAPLAALVLFFNQVNAQDGVDITRRMLKSAGQISRLTFHLEAHERFGTQMKMHSGLYKVNYEPYKVYHKQSLPEKGMEVLFAEGWNHNKAMVNPAGFPFINLSLNPHGNFIRQRTHLSVYDAGYNHFCSLLDYNVMRQHEHDLNAVIVVKGTEAIHGIECHHVTYTLPKFARVSYTVKDGENLASIAKARGLSDYMIKEINGFGGYDEAKAGQVIKIPNEYAQRMAVYIDKLRFIPLKIVVCDDQGLFEQYEFTHVVVNPEFAADEFTPNFGGYGF